MAGRQSGLPDIRAVPDMTTLRLYPWFEKSRYEHFLGKVRRNLNSAGVEVEMAGPGRGQGQGEVNLRYTEECNKNTALAY